MTEDELDLPMGPDEAADRLIENVNTGLEVLARERAVFMEGRYGEIEPISTIKQSLLSELEGIMTIVPRTVAVVDALNQLIRESRQNEMIIQAARQGVAHAKRRIEAILQTRSGVLAYAADGTRISSTADMGEQDSSA